SFEFRLHLFGPYSDEADAITDLLEADHVIYRDGQGNIVPTEQGVPVASSFQPDAQARRAIARIAKLFANEEPMSLELLATIKFIWDSERVVSRTVAPASVIRRVARYKGPKFSEQQIRKGVKRLREAKLVN